MPITDPDRVKLLVDEVSNSSEYVEAMAGDAMDTVMSEYGLDGAGCETFYLDLVDTENGNAKVTMGAGDSLKIYWPIPEQAGSSSRLYVVHYYGLDRTETDAGAELSAEPRHVQQADIEQVGGRALCGLWRSPASPPSRWSGRRAWTTRCPSPRRRRPRSPPSPYTRRTG